MARIATVYHSDSGTTRILAEGVHEGAASAEGCEASLHEIERSKIADGRFEDPALLEVLDAADAIVLGCPTFMGDVSAPMKAFLDASLERWYPQAWKGKVAAAFTVSSTPAGDKQGCLESLLRFSLQHGMIWVGLDQVPLNPDRLNRLSFYVGAAGQARYGGDAPALHDGDRETGVLLGARVARVSRALAAGA